MSVAGENSIPPPQYTESSEATEQPQQIFGPKIRPNDAVIGVMGVTGVGKSSFISLFAEDVAVGHSLEACTSKVEIHKCTLSPVQDLYLIDTPGFDDTYKSDTDILKEVATWLSLAYENNIRLTGIIYLHRITDVRLGGSAMKNLRMFKKLCGDEGLSNVVLATTMWNKQNNAAALEREQQLITKREFWAAMINNGSKVFRHDKGIESAREIVDYLISKKKPVILDIQRQMVDKRMLLVDTAAGKEVEAEIARQRERYEKDLKSVKEEMAEAIQAKDKEAQEELRKFRAEIDTKMRKDEEDRRRLQQKWDDLRVQKEKELEDERKQNYQKMVDNNERILTQQHELELQKQIYAHDAEMQKAAFQNEQLRAEARRREKKGCVVM